VACSSLQALLAARADPDSVDGGDAAAVHVAAARGEG